MYYVIYIRIAIFGCLQNRIMYVYVFPSVSVYLSVWLSVCLSVSVKLELYIHEQIFEL